MLIIQCCCAPAPALTPGCTEVEMPSRAEPCAPALAPAWPLALAEPRVPDGEPALAFVLPWAAPEPDTSTVLFPAPRMALDVCDSRPGWGAVSVPDCRVPDWLLVVFERACDTLPVASEPSEPTA